MKSLPTLGNSAKGFTLLEVVVAMTIVGLGIVTLLQIFSLGLRLGARSTVRTEVVTDGRQVMDDRAGGHGTGNPRPEKPLEIGGAGDEECLDGTFIVECLGTQRSCARCGDDRRRSREACRV